MKRFRRHDIQYHITERSFPITDTMDGTKQLHAAQ
jgi:hypothetical protein